MGQVSIGGGAVNGLLINNIVALTAAATVTLDASVGSIYTLTPTGATTINATNISNGEQVQLVVLTSGSSSFVVTFGTGFLSTGTLATGTTTAKTFVVTFIAQNGVLTEVSRTTAM